MLRAVTRRVLELGDGITDLDQAMTLLNTLGATSQRLANMIYKQRLLHGDKDTALLDASTPPLPTWPATLSPPTPLPAMTNISNAQLLASIQSLQAEIDQRFAGLSAESSQFRLQLTALAQTVDQLAALSQESHRTLRGSNGNPGLVAGIHEMKNQITDLENHIKSCSIHSVTTALHGSDKDPGLLERLRRLEDLDRSLRKWIYLALSSLLLGLLSLLFDLLPRLFRLF